MILSVITWELRIIFEFYLRKVAGSFRINICSSYISPAMLSPEIYYVNC